MRRSLRRAKGACAVKRAAAAIILLSLVLLLAAPFIGAAKLEFSALFDKGAPAYRIFWEIRLPRVVLAWLTGATLSVCGLIFQALFRNPLASPDMLGVSAGAALGAVLYIRLGAAFALFGLVSGMACAAFAGALAAVVALYAAAGMKRGGFSISSLMLAGIALNFLFAGLNMIVQYTGGYTDSFRMMRWTMGGLETVGFASVAASLPGFAAAALTAWAAGPQLDLLICGEETAAGRGVSVRALRNFLFAAVSLAVGINVALCGPIGFVGLMCPHICRRLTGLTKHRELSTAAVFFGGFFLVACDTAARTLWSPSELPVGILTSSLGSLFFIRLVMKGED